MRGSDEKFVWGKRCKRHITMLLWDVCTQTICLCVRKEFKSLRAAATKPLYEARINAPPRTTDFVYPSKETSQKGNERPGIWASATGYLADQVKNRTFYARRAAQETKRRWTMRKFDLGSHCYATWAPLIFFFFLNHISQSLASWFLLIQVRHQPALSQIPQHPHGLLYHRRVVAKLSSLAPTWLTAGCRPTLTGCWKGNLPPSGTSHRLSRRGRARPTPSFPTSAHPSAPLE